MLQTQSRLLAHVSKCHRVGHYACTLLDLDLDIDPKVRFLLGLPIVTIIA